MDEVKKVVKEECLVKEDISKRCSNIVDVEIRVKDETVGQEHAIAEKTMEPEQIVVKVEPIDITEQKENDHELDNGSNPIFVNIGSIHVKEETQSDTELKNDPDDTVQDKMNPEDINRINPHLYAMNLYYYCNDCNKQCVNKPELLRHLKYHDPKSKYACDKCNLRFRQLKSLKYHVLKAHDNIERIFSCNVCNKTFNWSVSLVGHMRMHNGEKPYSCQYCRKAFSIKASMVRHMKKHTKQNANICPICRRSFSDITKMKNHIRIHTGEKPFTCNICDKSYYAQNNLQSHMAKHGADEINQPKDKSGKNKKIKVEKCIVKPKLVTAVHNRKHTEEKPYSCDRKFSLKHSMKNVEISVKDEQVEQKTITVETMEPEQIVVKVEPTDITEQIESDHEVKEESDRTDVKVESVYVKEERTQSEIYIKIKNDPENPLQGNLNPEISHQISPHFNAMNLYYYCNDCNKQCVNKPELLRHLRYHDPKSKYACDKCNVRFSQLKGLKNHILKAHDNIKRTQIFTCNVCNKNFNWSASLEGHMRMHNGEKPYPCQYCEKAFTLKGSMVRHMKIHTGEKPNICPICRKPFLDITKMRNHIRIHTGEKPFACNICDKSYYAKNNLRSHMATHVANEMNQKKKPLEKKKKIKVEKSVDKPKVVTYTCESCDKTFPSKSKLAVHNRKHTGEKPYSCNICDRKFSLQHSMKAHVRTHTGEKPYSCLQCDKKFTQAGSLQSHVSYVHSTEKPFSCDVCKKGFSYKTKLVLHMRRHTGEKPYKCDECDKTFAILASLKKHLNKCPFINVLPAASTANKKKRVNKTPC